MKQYNEELKSGGFIHPQYTNNTFTDQKAIYDNRMYSKPIHETRNVEVDYNDEPLTIKNMYDKSITDFKKTMPQKLGKTGDIITEGNFEQSSFQPDYISYDDEKPENGGKYPNLGFYGYDPLISTDNAIF